MSDTPISPEPQQPAQQPAPQPAPAAPGAFERTLRSLTSRDWIAAGVTGAAGFVAAYVVAVVSLLLTAVVLAVSGGGSGSSGSAGSGDLGGSGSVPGVDASDVLSILAGAPAQLALLADFGRLRISGSFDVVVASVSGSASVGFVPVIIALAQLAVIVLGTRLFRRRDLSLGQLLVVAAATGLGLAIVSTLFGLLLGMKLPTEALAQIHRINAVSPLSIIVAFLVGAAASLAARPGWIARLHPALGRASGAIRTAAIHFSSLGAVLTVAVVIAAIVTQSGSAPALPILLGNVVSVLIVFGFLGGFGVSDSVGSLAAALSGSSASGASTSTSTVFANLPAWGWLLVLLALVSVFAAGLALGLRRGHPQRDTLDWVFSFGAYLLGGVVLLLVGTGVYSVQVSGVGGSGSVGVTPWSVLVVAAWGLVVEVVARYLAPRVIPALPAGLLRALSVLVGRDPVAPVVASPAASASPVAGSVSEGAAGTAAAAAHPGAAAASPGAYPGAAPAGAPARGGQAADPAALAPAKPMSPRARRTLLVSLIAAGAVVVLLIAGSIVGTSLKNGVYGPAAAAKAYLSDLSRGDATAARVAEGKPAAKEGLLTDAALKTATRITSPAVGKVTTSGDLATAAVSFEVAGKQHDATLRLTRTGTTWLFKDEWKVTPLTSSITVAADTIFGDADVTEGGATVGKLSDGSLQLDAYPGAYPLEVTGSEYVGSDPQTVTVTGDTVSFGADAQFEAKPTAALTTDAEKLANDLIDTCAASKSGELADDCPFYGLGSGYTKVSYKVTKRPTLSVELQGSGIYVTSDDSGTVVKNYTDTFFGESYSDSYDSDFSVYLELQVVDGKLQIVSSY